MKTFPTLAFLFAPLFAFAAATQPPADKLVLIIDGKRVPLEPGKPAMITGSFTNPTVSVEKLPFKTFNAAGLRFDYPAHLQWEAPKDDAGFFVLSGNDFKVMVMNAPVTPEAVMPGFIAAMKSEGKPTPTVRTINGITLKGLKNTGRLAGTQIFTEAYSVKTKAGSSLLILQDSPTDKPQSDEATAVMKVLNETFGTTR